MIFYITNYKYEKEYVHVYYCDICSKKFYIKESDACCSGRPRGSKKCPNCVDK